MATMPGRCINEMFCSFAASGQIVRVPADSRFVCPQCGKPLVAPNAPFRSRVHRGSAGGVISIILIIVGFIAGMALGGVFVWPEKPVIVPVNVIALPPPPTLRSVIVLSPPAPGSLPTAGPAGRRHGARPAQDAPPK
jgi:hypothetical protein